VVKQFDLNSDLFVLYDSAGDICSIARLIIRVPDYYCSFMYATQATEPKGAHYSIPEKHLRTSEIMALYREGKKGVVSFKYLMEYLTQYGTKIGHFDSVWTTYDECDNYTGTYYKNKFLMKETGVKLIYRDFGGLGCGICWLLNKWKPWRNFIIRSSGNEPFGEILWKLKK